MVKWRRHQLILPLLAEHRQLPRHTDALGRQAHGRPPLPAGELLDEAGRFYLLEDGVYLDTAIGHGCRRHPCTGMKAPMMAVLIGDGEGLVRAR
jgi:hypothetical protein